MLAACLASSAGEWNVGPDGHHQFEPFGDGRQRGGGAPGVERRGVDAFDVVEVEFGDERQVVADLLAAAGEPAHVIPGGLHAFVGHVAQPAAEDGEPVTVSHGRGS